MVWHNLEDIAQLQDIIDSSSEKPVLIFKHSTRCSISSMAKNRMERSWSFEDNQVTAYYLDLIAFRDISNHIAEIFEVEHQSPQALLIQDGKCIYDASHNSISVDMMAAELA